MLHNILGNPETLPEEIPRKSRGNPGRLPVFPLVSEGVAAGVCAGLTLGLDIYRAVGRSVGGFFAACGAHFTYERADGRAE